MFQKRHFEWVADAIHYSPFDPLTKGKLATYFGRKFASTNMLFDMDKFLRRCGVDDDE